ncbi:ROK family protein [Jonesia quinghaiensis]|uniref:ROK family protein n=1 Tax=Jonesia quinghaiensis TaxID=262806 RepID=UPI0004158EC6|nr:ROK family protein [Jonesia quinghaiensis]
MAVVHSAAGQHTLRERNLALVAQEIYSADEPLSRAAIAGRTGLTRATVSSLVDLLVDTQIVAELDPVFSRRAGRPAVPLVPARGTYFGIGLEVNVSYLGGVIHDLTGTPYHRVIIPGDFHGSNPTDVLNQLAHVTTELINAVHTSNDRPTHSTPIIAGAHLALPGLVDPNNATLRIAPNLRWADLDPVDTSAITTAITNATGQHITVRIGNEANYGALAAKHAAGLNTFIYVSGEVGIGSAIILDHTLFLGRRGWSGELGHVTIDPEGPPCSCGSQGCLEQYAGLDAILTAAGLETADGITGLTTALHTSDAAATAAVHSAAVALGRALSDYANLLDIHMVVLGGIYADLYPYIVETITQALRSQVLSAPWATFDILPGTLGSGAAMVGAAHEAVRDVYTNPSPWISTDAP